MSHTKGPWIVLDSDVVNGEGTVVCTLVHKDDARLIACAPELLDFILELEVNAVSDAEKKCGCDGDYDDGRMRYYACDNHRFLNDLQALIAKATGGAE